MNQDASQPEAVSLASLDLRPTHGSVRGADVSGLSVDSRELQSGNLFAALPGSNVHGAVFIRDAIENGAAAVLTDPRGFELAMSGPPSRRDPFHRRGQP